MDIQQSSIWPEIVKIRDAGSNPVHANWRCQIDTSDVLIDVGQLLEISVTREYYKKFSDVCMMRIRVSKREYEQSIYPNRDQLLITLLKEPIGELSDDDELDKDPDTRIYRGVLSNTESTQITSADNTSSTDADQDASDDVTISVQLLERCVEQLRMKSVGGIFVEHTTTEVVQGLLSSAAADLGLDEKESFIGVDVVKGENTEVRDHIVIPQGTNVVDLPKYIQEHCGGIYTHGLGYYCQDRIWYVYPENKLDRSKDEPRSLLLYNLPEGKLPGIERTYTTDGDRILVLGTGKTQQLDTTEKTQLTLGNGIRYGDATKVIDAFRTVADNVATVEPGANFRELVADERRVGLNFAPLSPRRITANPYFEISQIHSRMGQYISVQWENANADLIYPGMPVRYVYIVNDELRELNGQVAGATHLIAMKGKGRTASRYRCDVQLLLYLEKTQ